MSLPGSGGVLPPERKTAMVNPTRGGLPLTLDDTKILGKTTERRREKAVPPTKFQTRAFKTLTSNWTPLVHKPSNNQIFQERCELICNWFELWTNHQRKKFLDFLFRQCNKSQLYFIQNWFRDRVPLRHVDFTRVLPRFLSLYIFSFLDPRSLSRASMVCWNWKFFSEQDVVWQSKCMRQGWYLPYTPGDGEYGAWKRHYIACTHTLDMDVLARTKSELYGSIGDGKKTTKRKGNRLTLEESREVLELRPPWLPTDHDPKDLERSAKAILEEFNPNDPLCHTSMRQHHNQFGIVKTGLVRTGLMRQSAPGGLAEYGLQQSARRQQHRILDAEDDPDLRPTRQREPLSHSIELESFEERRMIDLVRQPWEPPPSAKMMSPRRPNLAGGGDYPLPWKHNTRQPISKSYPNQANPRIIFISSRVPAADILVDAVNFGVIPIVFEYEGTTLESLASQLDLCLQGRSAQSIGVFVHAEYPWELRLVHGSTVTLETLDDADHVVFFQTLASAVLPPEQGGHVDLFVPLGSCEPGTEMLIQLKVLTGVTFSAPTGIVGNYNHVNSEWMTSPEGVAPPTHYFCSSKLNMWANMADKVKEACKVTKQVVGRYFEQKHRDLVAQLVGQVIFDATGQADIQGVHQIVEALQDGLLELGHTQNVKEPLSHLGQYLLEYADKMAAAGGVDDMLTKTRQRKAAGGTLAPAPTMAAHTLTDHLQLDEQFADSIQDSECTDEADSEVAAITDASPAGHAGKASSKKVASRETPGSDVSSEVEEDLAEELDDEAQEAEEDLPEDLDQSDVSDEEFGGAQKTPRRAKSKGTVPKPQKSKSPKHVTMKYGAGDTLKGSGMWQDTLTSYGGGEHTARAARDQDPHSSRRLTTERLKSHPEKRTPVAREILASEVDYMRTLEVLQTVFVTPLQSAAASNRAILSAHNMQIIFSDALNLLQLSRGLVADLRKRLGDWNPSQCLGDIFVKLTGSMKTYVNFLNNYPTVLLTVERAAEKAPLFRAFLKRHERTPSTKMLTLVELLLIPTRRVNEYVTLLTWLTTYTPQGHADRADLQLAVRKLTELDQLIGECKLRSERERELLNLQKTIFSCPILLEANRYLIRQLDVSHLKQAMAATLGHTVTPERRTYQHVETLGLYLFSDALVVTRRTTRPLPFERSLVLEYKFEACCTLVRLRVEDIPDSKYVRNAFRLYTPRRGWICAADSFHDKFNWITLIEDTVRAAVQESS